MRFFVLLYHTDYGEMGFQLNLNKVKMGKIFFVYVEGGGKLCSSFSGSIPT